MEKQKRYRLLKDTIHMMGNTSIIVKAGEIIEGMATPFVYVSKKWGWYFGKDFVENTPDWFELIEDRITVNFIPNMCESANPEFKQGALTFSSKISKQKWDDIRAAIEFVLNEKDNFDFKHHWMQQTAQITARHWEKYGIKTYSEKELLEAGEMAFNAAREKSGYGISGDYFPKYKTFSDYKNSNT